MERSSLLLLCSLCATTTTTGGTAARPPHIIFVMADDLGSNDVGWQDATVLSPEIDALAAEGVKLGNMYTWDWCAPSRGAFLSGRYPSMSGFEGSSDAGGHSGGKLNVWNSAHSMIPATLKQANYSTVMAGKWHLGFARPSDTPEQRGFDTFLGYFVGGEDYYDHTATKGCGGVQLRDLWFASTPTNGRPVAKKDHYGIYSTHLYADFVAQQIRGHDAEASPLFIYAAFQGVHYPLEVPKPYFDRYEAQGAGAGDCKWELQNMGGNGIPNGFECDPNSAYPNLGKVGLSCVCNRLLVKAQVSALSQGVGNITAALRDSGMWDNSVLVFMGDNGGPNDGGHSNAPLRGGKLNFFEGGIRPAAFVTSPLLPKAVFGSKHSGIFHETDWHATFAALAGVQAPSDIDGVDAWPTLVNPAVKHRSEALISGNILRQDKWKLAVGSTDKLGQIAWYTGMLKGCVLGNGGGWMVPPTNKTNSCPGDIYTSGDRKSVV